MIVSYSVVDEVDDLEAKICPKCHNLQIKQEVDGAWFCQNCVMPYKNEKPLEEEINLRVCVNCGKESGIFEYCKYCRPND